MAAVDPVFIDFAIATSISTYGSDRGKMQAKQRLEGSNKVMVYACQCHHKWMHIYFFVKFKAFEENDGREYALFERR